MGYRIKSSETVIQGCAHNREYYGDREILQTLKKNKVVNLVVFVTREYGGIHLGGTRFDIITDLTNEVLRMMKPETADVATPSKPPPTNSQTPMQTQDASTSRKSGPKAAKYPKQNQWDDGAPSARKRFNFSGGGGGRGRNVGVIGDRNIVT